MWQQEWFYITEPRGTKWDAAHAFRSGPPLQLASWTNKGLDWGSPNGVSALQKCVKSMINKDVTLDDVIQVMLIRRTLPCQRRPLKMWEFNPEGARTLQHFYGTTHKKTWKLLFKKQKTWPRTSDDIRLDCNNPASLVSILLPHTT